MEILVKRIAKKSLYTIGKLYIDGKYECDTIEDRDRGLTSEMPLSTIKRIKIPNETAIPTGRYKITLKVLSLKFGAKTYYKNFCNGFLPRLLNVPGYEGILIHRGSDLNSSSGCLIVGKNTIVGQVTNSQECFEKLYKKLLACKDDIYITIL